MRKLELIIDHLPYPELNPNSRLHWAVKARAVRASKEEIGWLAKAQWHDEKPMMKARISYFFYAKNHRRRDLDNLLSACKAYQDGLIDAGVLFYDDAQHLEIGTVSLTTDTGDKTFIVTNDTTFIKVEEIE